MADHLISRADLSRIEAELDRIRANVGDVHMEVARGNAAVLDKIGGFYDEFAEFVATDRRHKELHLAETRVIKIRQDIESQFGYYGEVRRHAVGILQAVDHRLVRSEVLHQATEEMMMKAPRYWLAPALVALGAWVRDDRPLADRALSEALRRDDYKTSLFFALVLRRLQRQQGANVWLMRYMAHQNPRALDREFVLLLDAVASGAFGPGGRKVVADHVGAWLEDAAGFASDQERRWKQTLIAWRPSMPLDSYPLLRKHSATWDRLEASLASAKGYDKVLQHFQGIFDGEIKLSPHLSVEIDKLLDSLVSNFDDEELPLRSQESMLEYIIEANGDVHTATRKFEAGKTAMETTSTFTEMLTNAAMFPDKTHASRGTQRYALALSRDWIVEAHEQIVAEARAAVPLDIDVEIDGWSCQTRNGSEEDTLLAAQRAYYEQILAAALLAVKLPGFAMLCGVVGGLVALLGLGNTSFVSICIGLACIGYTFYERNKLKSRREAVQQDVNGRAQKAAEILRAVLAEVVDLRRELAADDAVAEHVREFLLDISPEQYTRGHGEDARAVIAG